MVVLALISTYIRSLVAQQQPFGSNLKGLFHHFEDRKHDDVLFDRERARAH